MKPSICLVVVAMLMAACDRQPVLTTPVAATAKSVGPASWLSVSDDQPAVGTDVIVVGNAEHASKGVTFGSFRAQLRYDPAYLEFIGDTPLPGALRAVNSDSGRVIVAGAAVAGFEDGKLFALRFRVRKARSFESMSLIVDELNDIAYESQLPTLRTLSAVQRERILH